MSAPEGRLRAETNDRLLRLLASVAFLGSFLAVILFAHGQPRSEAMAAFGSVLVAAAVVGLWSRLPERSRPKSRFTRAQLVTATFMTICLLGAVILPDILEAHMSTRRWVELPIVVAVLFVGFVVFERRHDDRLDRELAHWRRMRPRVRPKAR
jgi:uncharacterized membrane protein YfcA